MLKLSRIYQNVTMFHNIDHLETFVLQLFNLDKQGMRWQGCIFNQRAIQYIIDNYKNLFI
ncbi:MAG: hypothetical protein A2X79_01900 [Desulfuromonadaceae bacterium GWB2_53_15]|nr:MAG: hypothetical protein A2X79_01900 [Desulfuromonadaceae bacterium GWB2_53_15]